MPRPDFTTEGRAKPLGTKEQRSGIGGLTFTRVRGVRRLRGQTLEPRNIIELGSPEDTFEEKYQAWYLQWRGTRPEYVVFDYLVNRKKYQYGLDFAYQSSFLGGRQRLGGSVVDFEVYRDRVFIRVQGERFHTEPGNLARDLVQAVSITRTDYKVVDVWAEMVLQAPYQVVEAALRGITLRRSIGSQLQ